MIIITTTWIILEDIDYLIINRFRGVKNRVKGSKRGNLINVTRQYRRK